MTDTRKRFDDDDDDGLSLQPVLRTVWSYRRIMGIALQAIILLYVVIVFVIFTTAPREGVASLGFRLTFEGADRDEYPNGTKFSSTEIVGTPILSEVFRANELERYGSLNDVKDATFVLQANPAVEMLSYEYQTKLADPKLTAADRARLEDEFRRKREGLKSADYSLNLRRGGRLLGMPEALVGKVLQDVLVTWSKQAAERKGATRYDIPMLSNTPIKKEAIAAEEYVVATDMIRSRADRILQTLTQLEKIPGADAVRTENGRTGLADLRAEVEDILRFRIEPVMDTIRTNGLSKSGTKLDEYFQGRYVEVLLAQQESRQRMATLQEALRAYLQRDTPSIATVPQATTNPTSNVTPQVTESFIDRIINLSTQSEDVKYRQDLTGRIIDEGLRLADFTKQTDYYLTMQKSFAAAPRNTGRSPLEADVERRMIAVAEELNRALERVKGLYDTVSQETLNPSTVLYTITTPFSTRTTTPISPRTVLFYLFVTLIASAVLLPIACLIYDYFHNWITPATPSGRSGTPAAV